MVSALVVQNLWKPRLRRGWTMSSPDGAYANAAGVLKFLRIESFYWHQMASVFLISHVKPIDLCLKKILIFGSESVIHDVLLSFFRL